MTIGRYKWKHIKRLICRYNIMLGYILSWDTGRYEGKLPLRGTQELVIVMTVMQVINDNVAR